MPGVFVSYRRIDSRAYSGRLFDRLSRHFGPDMVFMDTEGGIARGEDFAKTIEGAVNSVAAMVVIIGRQWVACTDDSGRRRLDNPDDWVRREITTALTRNILLVPVLVDGAIMPREHELPESLCALAHRQAAEISDGRWDYDTGEIITTLERVVSARRHAPWKWIGLAGAALAGLLIAILAWNAMAPKPEDYAFTVDPPQVRFLHDASTVQVVDLKVTNTGKRAAPFQIDASFFTARPSEGALVIGEDTCKTRPVPPGAACTAKIVLNPKWLTGDEPRQTFNGQLFILADGNGRSIPLTIEPPTTATAAAPSRNDGRGPVDARPAARSRLDAYEAGKGVNVTLTNQKRIALLVGDITQTRADVIVRFTDERGLGRDDVDISRYAGPSFEQQFQQELASSFGGRMDPGSAIGSRVDRGVAGQTVCSTFAPVDESDPDFTQRLGRAYQNCFSLAATGSALSVAFPVLGIADRTAPTVVETLVTDLLKETRLSRIFLVLSPQKVETLSVYSAALLKRLELQAPPAGQRQTRPPTSDR